jgi:GTP-binding protein EngB required for normal cell division
VTTQAVPGVGLPSLNLPERLDALAELVRIGSARGGPDGFGPELMAQCEDVLRRAGQRLRMSSSHTVVAIAGGTGSGKSSLFNALSGATFSPVGVTRPTTTKHVRACVWGMQGAAPLLDWLGVQRRHRYARASALDAGEADLDGLLLLDLPDHDSVVTASLATVDRMTKQADMLIWVLDPQKYADNAVHSKYLIPLAGHANVMAVVLNQVDLLTPEQAADCEADLRRLLDSEGLDAAQLLTVSARTGAGMEDLRNALVRSVSVSRAASERIAADIDTVLAGFGDYDAGPVAPPRAAVVAGADGDASVDGGSAGNGAGVDGGAGSSAVAHSGAGLSGVGLSAADPQGGTGQGGAGQGGVGLGGGGTDPAGAGGSVFGGSGLARAGAGPGLAGVGAGRGLAGRGPAGPGLAGAGLAGAGAGGAMLGAEQQPDARPPWEMGSDGLRALVAKPPWDDAESDAREDADWVASVPQWQAAELAGAFARAAGITAICDALQSAVEGRSARYVTWPLARLARLRRRSDPLRGLGRGGPGGPRAIAEAAGDPRKSDIDNAITGFADQVSSPLPQPWDQLTREAARSRAASVPAALSAAMRDELPERDRAPGWWGLAMLWQWLLVAVMVAGIAWIAVIVAFHLSHHHGSHMLTDTSLLPWLGVMVVAIGLLGWLTASGSQNMVLLAADRDRDRIEAKLRGQASKVARDLVLTPTGQQIAEYEKFRHQLALARGASPQ